MRSTDEAYSNLAAAIVLKAIEDYRAVMKTVKNSRRHSEKIDPRTLEKQLELEDFFDSSWCDMLCGFDGSAIKRKIGMRYC